MDGDGAGERARGPALPAHRGGQLIRGLALLVLAAAATPAAAQNVVTSPAPASVDVTVYRDPNRAAGTAPNLRWLNGFALISETRVVSIPAGESDVRFEGVAGGILPQSAIVTGFPDGIVERNRDAYLLSPSTLLDRSLGRRVHLRRTSLATGAVREHEANVRSGADGAVVLETADGLEALRCSGLRETLVYDQVPPGLSATPALSVRVRSREALNATVTLSYLASGFDWQADYVATLSPAGDRIDLFAWLTLASVDETSFIAADTQAVAGRLNRESAAVSPSEGGPLTLTCWPHGTTSDIPQERYERIVVTGSRARRGGASQNLEMASPITAISSEMVAIQEELGDLKLYRIPEPVTVAARSQKQVALLQRPGVAVDLVYRQRVLGTDSRLEAPARRVLVTRNRDQDGLGLPLPAGSLRLFAESGQRSMLVGQGVIEDRAIGEDVEIDIGPAPGIRTELRLLSHAKGRREYELAVTNDRAEPIRFEAELASGFRTRSPVRFSLRRDGWPVWTPTVPANGRAVLRYRVSDAP